MGEISQEQSWADTLTRARRSAQQSRRTTTIEERLHVLRDMSDAKRALRLACRARQDAEAKTWLDRLITLRAEQTAIALAEEEQLYGTIPDTVLTEECRRYAEDCTRLMRSVTTLIHRQ